MHVLWSACVFSYPAWPDYLLVIQHYHLPLYYQEKVRIPYILHLFLCKAPDQSVSTWSTCVRFAKWRRFFVTSLGWRKLGFQNRQASIGWWSSRFRLSIQNNVGFPHNLYFFLSFNSVSQKVAGQHSVWLRIFFPWLIDGCLPTWQKYMRATLSWLQYIKLSTRDSNTISTVYNPSTGEYELID